MSLRTRKLAATATLTFVLAGGLVGCSSGTASTDEEVAAETEIDETEASETDDQGLEQTEDVCMGNVDLRE